MQATRATGKRGEAVDNKRARGGTGAGLGIGKDHRKFIPTIVVWLARAALFALGYRNHSVSGFIHISWVVLSFIISIREILLVSISAYLPILLWEFIFVYCSRMPHV